MYLSWQSRGLRAQARDRALQPRGPLRLQIQRLPTLCRATAKDLPDGDLGLPVIGESLALITEGDTFGSSRRAKYGDVYKTNILGAPTIMVYGQEAVTAVLTAEDKLVATDWPQVTSVLVGRDSLNLLTGQRHGAVKRQLAEAFSERVMRRYVPRIERVVQEYLERWAQGPQPIPGYASSQELSQAVFDCVVLGGDGGPQRAAQLQDIMARLQVGFQTPPLDLPFTDYGKAVAARREFGQMVSEAVSRCRNGPDAGTPPSDSALSDIASASSTSSGSGASTAERLPDSVIEDNMTAAFFGNASAGPTVAKALQYLAASPAVVDKLFAEQQGIIARHGTAITAKALDEMPYGAAVAKELLRITPAVPAVFRVAIVDFELAGRIVPKGWRVWCHLGDSVLKYNKDVFDPNWWLQPLHQNQQPHKPEPDAKDPATAPVAAPAVTAGGCPVFARAAPEYSLPFGTGVRTCLGRHLVMAELLVVLALLVRGCQWEAVTPGEEWRVVPAPAPKAGLLVNLRRRRR